MVSASEPLAHDTCRHLLGYAGDIPRDEDWFTGMQGSLPIFVHRHDGRLFCFANACTHRGFPLRNGDFGHGLLRCPLHQWVFDGEGRLSDVRGVTPADLRAFDSDLAPLAIDEIGPWIFARNGASDEPVALRAALSSCVRLLTRFDIPAPTAEIDGPALSLGPNADLWHSHMAGRYYRLVRLILPDLATSRTTWRCWIFSTRPDAPDNADRVVAATITAGLTNR